MLSKKLPYTLTVTLPALLLLPFLLLGQEHYKTIGLDELKDKERKLAVTGDSIVRGIADSSRVNANIFYAESMASLLSYQNTFDYGFDSLKNVSILKSSDGRVKIYTWTLQAVNKNSYTYFGFVQVFDKKTKQVTLHRLTERKYENEEAMSKVCMPDEWYGAYYYRMIEKKINGSNTYTLLGWHGNNWKTNRKVIDILVLKPGKIEFGAPVFKGGGKSKYRVVFEFTSQAVMKLAFDEKKKMIVFDRLSAPPKAEKNQYEFYGPDFRYDGYKFKKGYWLLQKDLDLRNPKSADAKEGKKEKGKTLYVPGGE